MSFSITSLIESGGANLGFHGGSYVDTHPHLSLSEATAMLPCIVVECFMDAVHRQSTENNSVIHETVRALSESSMPNLAPLNEAAFEGMRKHVEKFFSTIIAHVRSIIAKLQSHIDGLTKSGNELWAKYSSQLQSDAAYKDLVFNGYMFKRGEATIRKIGVTKGKNIDGVIMEAMRKTQALILWTPKQYTNVMVQTLKAYQTDVYNTDVQKMKEQVETLDNLDPEDRQYAFASTLADEHVTREEWETGLRKAAWGEKVDIHYGTDMFSISALKDILGVSNYLGVVKKEYEDFESMLVKYKAELEHETATLDQILDRAGMNSANLRAMCNMYYTAYMKFVQDAINVVSKMKNIKVVFYQEMIAQASRMFQMLIHAKKAPGATSEDAAGDIEFLEFEL